MLSNTIILSSIIFVISLVLCYIPSRITSTKFLKAVYPYVTIAAAGFMLAMLLMDFIPHITGSCEKHNHNNHHTKKECREPLTCHEHKNEIYTEKKKTSHDDHSGHNHGDHHGHNHGNHSEHNHGDHHGHNHEHSFFMKNFGFFVAGLAFIFLLGIDSIFLQHSHCENEDLVYMNDGLNHGPHKHEYCHIHGEDEKNLGSNQINESGNNEETKIEKTVELKNENEVGSDPNSIKTKQENQEKKEQRIEMHTHDEKKFHLEGGCNTSALKDQKGKIQAIIFIIALSIHSLFEGLAIKAQKIEIFEVGIIIHKALESFALGFTVSLADFTFYYKILLMSIYSLLTPLGMFISYFIQTLKVTQRSEKIQFLLKSICNGLALGSILFIVCVEMIPPNFHSKGANLGKIITLTVGYLLTSLIIYFVH